jgi:hypothetical protein
LKTIEKENLYIRILKKSLIKEIPGRIEQTSNPNSSFIECILHDCFKEILCNQGFDSVLSERLDNQPLGLYQWTNNVPYVSHDDVRSKIMSNYLNKAMSNTVELSGSSFVNKRTMLAQQRSSSSQQSNHSKTHKTPMERGENTNTNQNIGKEEFTDQEENKIEDKYMHELIEKQGYTNPEVNEKLLLVNEDSKNLIFNILENTIYNIISEAVYGETDLTEKTRIYFLKK